MFIAADRPWASSAAFTASFASLRANIGLAAMRLAKKGKQAITLINAGDTFQERVRNHQLAAGQRVRRHALPELLEGMRVTFLQGKVTAWQPDEQQVTVQISELFEIARETRDYQGEQFIQWFLEEQVEEEASMSDLLAVAERTRDIPVLLEEYLARETPGESA